MEVKSCSKEVLTELTEIRKYPGMTMSVFVPIASPPVLFAIKKKILETLQNQFYLYFKLHVPLNRGAVNPDVQSKGGTQRLEIEILVVRTQIN